MIASTGNEQTTPTRTEAPAWDAPAPLPTVHLRGTRLHAITEAQCVQHIMDELDAARGGWLVTHNLDHLRRLLSDRSFAQLCRDASVAVADGMPLLWASALQGTRLPERVAGSNLVVSLSAAAAERRRSIFFLGGDPGTAAAAAQVLADRFPGLRVAGTDCPAVGFEHDDAQREAITERLVDASPDIVYVALGSPKQEQLIGRMRSALPLTWWVGVGISFSFLSGSVRRTPQWMQNTGLEWTHRLAQEPGRLYRRYLIEGLPFAARLLLTAAWERRHGRAAVR